MSIEPTNPSAEHDNIEQLKGQKSVGEVLRAAMGFERTAREFYKRLTTRVSKPVRALVEELAAEEARHYDLFKELSERPDIQEHVRDRIQCPPSDHRFSDYIHSPAICDFPDEQSILQYAMGREQAAMEQYRFLAEQELPQPLREVFEYLAHEELLHKGELEKRYYELVYTTNV